MYTRYAAQSQASGLPGVPSPGVSPLRIATFNLLHGQPLAADGSPLPYPDQAADPLFEAIAALDADVLALQEVDRYQQRSGLSDQSAVAAKAMGATDWRFAAALHGRPAPVAGWLREPAVPGLRVYGPQEVETATELPSYGTALLTRLPVRHWRARRFAPRPVRTAAARGRAARAHARARRAAGGAGGRPGGRPRPVHRGRHPPVLRARLEHGPTGRHPPLDRRPAPPLPGARRLQSGRPGPAHRARRGHRAGPHTRHPPAPARAARPAPLPPAARCAAPPGPRGLAAAARLARPGPHPTYPSHRPAVQFDHVLAVGVPRTAVGTVSAPRVGVSDHRPLLVEVEL